MTAAHRRLRRPAAAPADADAKGPLAEQLRQAKLKPTKYGSHGSLSDASEEPEEAPPSSSLFSKNKKKKAGTPAQRAAAAAQVNKVLGSQAARKSSASPPMAKKVAGKKKAGSAEQRDAARAELKKRAFVDRQGNAKTFTPRDSGDADADTSWTLQMMCPDGAIHTFSPPNGPRTHGRMLYDQVSQVTGIRANFLKLQTSDGRPILRNAGTLTEFHLVDGGTVVVHCEDYAVRVRVSGTMREVPGIMANMTTPAMLRTSLAKAGFLAPNAVVDFRFMDSDLGQRDMSLSVEEVGYSVGSDDYFDVVERGNPLKKEGTGIGDAAAAMAALRDGR